MKTFVLKAACALIAFACFASVVSAQTAKSNQSKKKSPTQISKTPKEQNIGISKTVTLTAPGTLESRLSASEKKTLNSITLKGVIDQRDFIVISEMMPVLKSIDISDVVIKAYENYPENALPASAFFGMSKLSKIILPNNLEAIGYNGFYGCSALKELTLPNSVKKIGGQAFIYCGLKTIKIGASFTEGIGVLRDCESLESISIDSSSKRFSLFYGLVYNYAKDSLIFCPPAKQTDFGELEFHPDLKVIDKMAFYRCKRLSGILSLPNNLKEIGASAFYGCIELTGVVEIPSTTIRIGRSAFNNSNISKIIIPLKKYKDDPAIKGCFVDGSVDCELEIKAEN